MKRLTDNPNRPRPSRGGFTLIELLVVILIISILVTLAVNIGRYVYDRANRTETQSTLELIGSALEAFRDEYRVYPPDEGNDVEAGGERLARYLTGRMDSDDHSALDTLRTQAENDLNTRFRPLDGMDDENLRIKREVTPKLGNLPQEAYANGRFRDAWGNALGYDRDGGAGRTPLLISPGPDGDFDTEDDITSDGSS